MPCMEHGTRALSTYYKRTTKTVRAVANITITTVGLLTNNTKRKAAKELSAKNKARTALKKKKAFRMGIHPHAHRGGGVSRSLDEVIMTHDSMKCGVLREVRATEY